MQLCPKCSEREVMAKDQRWCNQCRRIYARMRYLLTHPGSVSYQKALNCERCGSEGQLAVNRRICNTCLKAEKRSWYRTNIERALAKKREYVAANQEKVRQSQKSRYWSDIENNRERCRNKRYRDGGRTDALQLLWRKRHFFQLAAMRLRTRCKEPISARALWSIWKQQRGRCALTGRKLNARAKGGVSIDHIIPRSLGGRTSIDNLRWVQTDANIAKGKLSDAEFLRMCHDVVLHSMTRQTTRREMNEASI